LGGACCAKSWQGKSQPKTLRIRAIWDGGKTRKKQKKGKKGRKQKRNLTSPLNNEKDGHTVSLVGNQSL